jgi:hypothetical protein
MPAAAARDAVRGLLLGLANLGAIRLFLLLLTLGIAVRTLMLLALDVPLELQFAEMERIARHLFRRGAFADPYKVQTGPTAHHAPVYPFLISLLFTAFGLTVAAGFAMAVMNFVFASLQWALVPIISVKSNLPRTVGVAAALLGATLPYRFMKEVRWEAALVGAVLATLTLLTLHWWQRPQPRAAHSFVLGLAWGTGMMCSPNLLPVFVVTVAIVVITSGRQRRRALIAHSAVVAVGVVIAVTPWTVRNYKALGAFVFVRSNFGLEFSISNNPSAFVLAVDNLGKDDPTNYFHTHHPWSSREEAQALLREGEVAYNRRKLHETMAWIRSDPGQFGRLTAGRIAYFWFTPYTAQAWKNFVVTPLTLLAFYGLWSMLRQRLPLGYLLLAMWISYPLVYYLVQTDTRYRYPIEWTFVLLAVFALYTMIAPAKRMAIHENCRRS